jgi:hypothetical protein
MTAAISAEIFIIRIDKTLKLDPFLSREVGRPR